MTEYKPDSWVVLKMNHKGEVLYKVLGGWAGSYTQGDSWRLNSGITKAEYDVSNDTWRFYGSSGSVYVVNPESYGLRMSTASIYEKMIKTYPDQVELLENCNWEEVDWTN
jgi:hypothetical protein